MTDERWLQFIELAEEQFDNVAVSREDIMVQTEDGPVARGSIDILLFEKDGEYYKLERENKPLILEKKEHYAKRATDTARTEYVLSETEFTHKLRVYRENMNGDWEEISTSDLGL